MQSEPAWGFRAAELFLSSRKRMLWKLAEKPEPVIPLGSISTAFGFVNVYRVGTEVFFEGSDMWGLVTLQDALAAELPKIRKLAGIEEPKLQEKLAALKGKLGGH